MSACCCEKGAPDRPRFLRTVQLYFARSRRGTILCVRAMYAIFVYVGARHRSYWNLWCVTMMELCTHTCVCVQGAAAKAPAKKLVAGKDIKAQQFKVGEKTVSLGFTKSNELFVSRAAMIGIATSIIGEVCPLPFGQYAFRCCVSCVVLQVAHVWCQLHCILDLNRLHVLDKG